MRDCYKCKNNLVGGRGASGSRGNGRNGGRGNGGGNGKGKQWLNNVQGAQTMDVNEVMRLGLAAMNNKLS